MSSEFTRGGFTALERAAEFARSAGKRRTAAWLAACAALVEHKGFVVHVENPEADLRSLTADQLAALFKAVEDEQFRREVG